MVAWGACGDWDMVVLLEAVRFGAYFEVHEMKALRSSVWSSGSSKGCAESVVPDHCIKVPPCTQQVRGLVPMDTVRDGDAGIGEVVDWVASTEGVGDGWGGDLVAPRIQVGIG